MGCYTSNLIIPRSNEIEQTGIFGFLTINHKKQKKILYDEFLL